MHGVWMESQDDLERAFLQFSKGLLGSCNTNRKHVSQTILNEGMILNNKQQAELCRAFNGEDVRKAIFNIDDYKASGPDGYSSLFFKKSWQCVGP